MAMAMAGKNAFNCLICALPTREKQRIVKAFYFLQIGLANCCCRRTEHKANNQQLDENFEMGDIIEDKSALHSERVVASAMLQEEIIDMLSFLKPREMEIISKRYGLDGERPKTLKEIGQMYNISRERVRQIEDVCLRKLKKLMKKKKIFYHP